MSHKDLTCPMCERGTLTPVTYSETFQHHGAELHVSGLEGYECECCGADPIFDDQIRRNHARILDARRRADGLLTGEEIRVLRDRLGLTQKAASELFGGGANAFSKYERGEVVQSAAMDRLLRLVGRYPRLMADLKDTEQLQGLIPVNRDREYVDGNRVWIAGISRGTTVRGDLATVVEIDQWKRAHAA
jgi:HTH-type transcriptional regulator / antitoxin MqsA